jgi:hypothetical protein
MDLTEHVADAELFGMLSVLRGRMAEGGKLYIHTPNLDFFWELLKEYTPTPQIKGHIAVRTAEQYIELLNHAGFKDIKVRKLSHYMWFWKWAHWFRSVPWIGKYMEARLFIEVTA